MIIYYYILMLIHYSLLIHSQCGNLHMTFCTPGVSSTGTATGIWSRTFTWHWIRWRAQWPSSGDRSLELSSLSTVWRSWELLPFTEVRTLHIEVNRHDDYFVLLFLMWQNIHPWWHLFWILLLYTRLYFICDVFYMSAVFTALPVIYCDIEMATSVEHV